MFLVTIQQVYTLNVFGCYATGIHLFIAVFFLPGDEMKKVVTQSVVLIFEEFI